MKIKLEVDIDKCIAREIQSLNLKNINTEYSCCGHNITYSIKTKKIKRIIKDKGYISVGDDLKSVRKMVRMGYKLRSMSCEVRSNIWWDNDNENYQNNLYDTRLVRIYTFYPKSKCQCKPKTKIVK